VGSLRSDDPRFRMTRRGTRRTTRLSLTSYTMHKMAPLSLSIDNFIRPLTLTAIRVTFGHSLFAHLAPRDSLEWRLCPRKLCAADRSLSKGQRRWPSSGQMRSRRKLGSHRRVKEVLYRVAVSPAFFKKCPQKMVLLIVTLRIAVHAEMAYVRYEPETIYYLEH